MKSLLKNIERLLVELKGRKIFLFLDYDGTLAPIVNTPAKATMSRKMKGLLKKIAQTPGITSVIISGRSLPDLKNRIKVPRLIYVGNHGLEMDRYGVYVNFTHDDHYEVTIKHIESELRHSLRDIKGVILENKKIALAMHYRLVAPGQVKTVKKIFTTVAKPLIRENKLRFRSGKKVLELIPAVAWGKGKFVKWLLNTEYTDNIETAVLYFGDDLTDEESFKALGTKAYTVFIGSPGKSAARYFLRNPQEVAVVLAKLVKNI